MVVPGSIFSENSKGVHQFLKLGAIPVTCSDDILEALRIEKTKQPQQPTLSLSPTEMRILETLTTPTHRDELIRKLNLPTSEASQLLMMMELQGHVYSEQNIYRRTLYIRLINRNPNGNCTEYY
jgi:DNA processing protein